MAQRRDEMGKHCRNTENSAKKPKQTRNETEPERKATEEKKIRVEEEK